MQVQPLVPLRNSFNEPFASIVTTDAACEIDAGAADSALAIGSFDAVDVDEAADVFVAIASLDLLVAGVPALLHPPSDRNATPAASSMYIFLNFMIPLRSLVGRRGRLAQPNNSRTLQRVDLDRRLRHGVCVTVARISELDRRTTQSGKANTGRWLLEFERQQAMRADPLTGWNGSSDTRPQVRLTFPTKEAAIAYCEKHGLEYHVVPAAKVRLKLQAYADNFR
jgi:hypothetical protein